MQHLLLRLESPMMSFGAVAVDNLGVIQRWPAVSMLSGLLGNALGYRRTDGELLNRLQARLIWAARLDRAGIPVQDFQTAKLEKNDRGWTTSGEVEGRAGGGPTYDSPHIRKRDYVADGSVAVALRLAPADESPTLDELAQALRYPARPLFVGRKSCLPSTQVLLGACDATDLLAALTSAPRADGGSRTPSVFFNDGDLADRARRRHRASDERRFDLDVHAGAVTVFETTLDEVQAA